MPENNDLTKDAIETYLSNPGINFPRFVIFDRRTGLFIDDARSIRERNEKVRNLKDYPWFFDIGWDFFKSVIKNANEPFKGWLVYSRLYYTMELNVARKGYPEYFQRSGVV